MRKSTTLYCISAASFPPLLMVVNNNLANAVAIVSAVIGIVLTIIIFLNVFRNINVVNKKTKILIIALFSACLYYIGYLLWGNSRTSYLLSFSLFFGSLFMFILLLGHYKLVAVTNFTKILEYLLAFLFVSFMLLYVYKMFFVPVKKNPQVFNPAVEGEVISVDSKFVPLGCGGSNTFF